VGTVSGAEFVVFMLNMFSPDQQTVDTLTHDHDGIITGGDDESDTALGKRRSVYEPLVYFL
jgi:hypothetical protein